MEVVLGGVLYAALVIPLIVYAVLALIERKERRERKAYVMEIGDKHFCSLCGTLVRSHQYRCKACDAKLEWE